MGPVLAIASCADLPDWEVDDQPLHEALEARGARFEIVPWDADTDWSRYASVLIRTTWDYCEKVEAFVDWAERTESVTQLLAPACVVRWNTDKRYLADLEQRGVPIAPTVWLPAGTAVDVTALVHRKGWTRGFLKPRIGATARETLRFEADAPGLAAAQAHVDRVLAREDLLLQPYLPAVETDGELSVIVIDGKREHGVRKRPVPGDYRVQDDFGATDEPLGDHPEAELLAEQTLASVRAHLGDALEGRPLLVARVDMLRGPSGALVVNEVELVEPSLFFRHRRQTAVALADAWLDRVARR